MIPQEANLLQLLSNNDATFFIPPYQRNYEWSEEQCNVFLEDIKKTYDSNSVGKKTEHFFGSVTYFQNETVFGQPNKLVLIDGQQRITTTMLLLVALRDIMDTQQLKDFIDMKYLKNNNVEDDSEYKIKLKQVETDWIAYKKIILSEELSDKEKNSAVYRNYKYFYNKVLNYKEQNINLEELIEKGLNKFSVITIELQPLKNEWENPQEIFESMNSLGKPLSLADLVRNFLLLGLDTDTQNKYYNKYWLAMEKAIPGKVSNFIRDYMQAYERKSYVKASEANYKDLYRIFKQIFLEKSVKDLLEELSTYAEIYAYIIPGGTCGNDNIDRILHDLQVLNVTTAYSFLLVLLYNWKQKKFSDLDIIDILDVFKVYCLRRRILAMTAGENKSFPLLSSQVQRLIEASNKKETMFEILSNQESNLRLPNDIEIMRYMETMNFYNFRYCKFYLALIEEKITKSRPDTSDKLLQIEHIMPQQLNNAWKAALGPNYEIIQQEYINNIGNLTLIRHNQELGQKLFNEKKEIYQNKTGLQIAKTKIIDQDTWNDITIKNRAQWIIEYLTNNVMPIPDNRRRVNNFKIKTHKGLSFQDLQLIGLNIAFLSDESIVAHVVSDKEVEFEGKRWRLSPLTREIQTRKGVVNASGAYQGAQYWTYDGMKLADIM